LSKKKKGTNHWGDVHNEKLKKTTGDPKRKDFIIKGVEKLRQMLEG